MHRAIRLNSALRRACTYSGLRTSVATQFPKAVGSSLAVTRAFSTEKEVKAEVPNSEETKKNNAVAKYDYDEYDDYEEPTTAGGWVRFYSRVAFQLGLLGLGMVCVYFTAKELFPGRLGAQSLFSEAFDRIRNHEEVMVMAGHDMKAFGRDVGRNEGRRNHVDSYSYKAEDGSNRTRIRFNVKGDKGKVIVWVEVSDKMADNEYVYLICQNARTGRVVTVEDNRDRLESDLLNNAPDVSANLISKFFKKD